MSNMKGLFKVFMVLFLLGLCSSSNQSYCQTQFVFDPAWMDISSETGGAEIGLEFTGDGAYWTVTTEADWLTIDPAEGEGASSITIEYSANEGLGRRAEILFQAPDSDIPAFTYLLRQQHSIPAEDLSFKWSVLEIDNAHQELVPYTGSMTVWFKAWEPAVYLNIVARNGEGQDPEWIIRNLYIPEASWFSRQQNLAVSFDLGLLGYDMGQPIEYLQFGYALSLYPDTLIMDIPDPDWREGIFELEKQGVMGYPPGWVYNGYPLTEFFPKEAFGDTITNKHYIGCEMKNGDIDYATYPWQVEGCGPAAAANSLMWLRDKHKEINFPGDFNQIMLYLSALMGKRGNGVSSEGFIRGKLDFIEMYKLPIKVKF
ncbi:MAG: BACON domain-containing protein [Bacteroidetes bacterium]|nr:BACON domain-containing protein [Bacteroidota bacterium]